MNKCEKCGFMHYRTDPCREPTESTAARMDVPNQKATGQRALNASGAGTQALPVDTIGPSPVDGSANLQRHTARFDPSDGPTKFDKKAWMREYMREHRRGIRRRSKETKLPLEGK